MLGWILFGLAVFALLLLYKRHITRRVHLADCIALLLLDENILDRMRVDYLEWLAKEETAETKALYLRTNSAIEERVERMFAHPDALVAVQQTILGAWTAARKSD